MEDVGGGSGGGRGLFCLGRSNVLVVESDLEEAALIRTLRESIIAALLDDINGNSGTGAKQKAMRRFDDHNANEKKRSSKPRKICESRNAIYGGVNMGVEG